MSKELKPTQSEIQELEQALEPSSLHIDLKHSKIDTNKPMWLSQDSSVKMQKLRDSQQADEVVPLKIETEYTPPSTKSGIGRWRPENLTEIAETDKVTKLPIGTRRKFLKQLAVLAGSASLVGITKSFAESTIENSKTMPNRDVDNKKLNSIITKITIGEELTDEEQKYLEQNHKPISGK
jgi:hypothetical protein